MEAETVKKRYDYLDIAKAITIFLVIMGHAGATEDLSFYRLVIYSFHMPLFFMVSGIVSRRHYNSGYGYNHWKDFFTKNILALVFPYFIWGLIYSEFSYENLLKILYGSWEMIKEAQSLSSLWFLPCLFFARIFVEIILMVSMNIRNIERHLFAGLAAAPLFAIGLLLPQLEKGYPWDINISFVAAGFMLLGYALKDVILSLKDKKNLFISGILAISVVIFTCTVLIQGENMTIMHMCSADYGNLFSFFLCSLSGSAAVILLSVILSNVLDNLKNSKIKRDVLWIGANTMGIYILHKPYLQQVVLKALGIFGLTADSVITAFLGAILTLPVCCVLIFVINKFIPQLFGQFPEARKLAVKDSKADELAVESYDDFEEDNKHKSYSSFKKQEKLESVFRDKLKKRTEKISLKKPEKTAGSETKDKKTDEKTDENLLSL